jgi:hypothetical protein
MAGKYIALTTSLPHLPHFERAARLPITERALGQRLRTLDEGDYSQLARAVALLRWKRQAMTETTQAIDLRYHQFMDSATNSALRDYVDWHIGTRTAVAALRLKLPGHATAPEVPWGAGRFVRVIERNWSKPEVGMGAVCPWLQRANQLLVAGDAIALEQLQMSVVWRRLTALGEIDPFGFEYAASYAFKWDIFFHWMAHDAVQAVERFWNLTEEAISGPRPVSA